MKNQLLLWFLFFSFFANGQIFLNGIVQDTEGRPLPYASIYQLNSFMGADSIYIPETDKLNYIPTNYSVNSDIYGGFHILLDTTEALNLKITKYGYHDGEIYLEEFLNDPLIVQLKKDSVIHARYLRKRIQRPSEMSMGIDYLGKDFKEFANILGQDNVDQLRRIPITFTFEFAKNFKRLYTGISFGFSFNEKRIEDTLNIAVNQSLYGFHIGYKLIDAKRILLMPQISAKLYRQRLINGYVGDDIPLNNYLDRQDLDLRFKQGVADLGITLGYKYYAQRTRPRYYTILGMNVGYPIRINSNPKIHSIKSPISTDRTIALSNFSLAIFLRAYFGVRN